MKFPKLDVPGFNLSHPLIKRTDRKRTTSEDSDDFPSTGDEEVTTGVSRLTSFVSDSIRDTGRDTVLEYTDYGKSTDTHQKIKKKHVPKRHVSQYRCSP